MEHKVLLCVSVSHSVRRIDSVSVFGVGVLNIWKLCLLDTRYPEAFVAFFFDQLHGVCHQITCPVESIGS